MRIDIICPIYYNYQLAIDQIDMFKKIKGEWNLLFCDNTSVKDQQEIVIPEEYRDRIKVFHHQAEGIDGEKHGSVLDYMVKQTTSKIIGIMDSDFFWFNEDIISIVNDKFSKGIKCMGAELHYTGFEYVNDMYPERSGHLAPCVFGMFIDRDIALSETFVCTRHEGHTERRETGWRIRSKIINEKIPCIVFPAIQIPRQSSVDCGQGGCWFYVIERKVSAVHLLQGSGAKSQITSRLLENLVSLLEN